MENHHSVQLISEKCVGCTDCIKRCPTEAIRVRGGKAMIKADRCIDCGMCIRVCGNQAKKATTRPLADINNYKYKIALPAPTLYGQFQKISDVNVILTALKGIGFDDVFEVSYAAEMVTEQTRKYLQTANTKRPVISGACPAVVRVIRMRFPSLLDHILPLVPPVEVAAAAAKQVAVKQGVPPGDIGVFFISPCAAKATYVSHPLGVEKSAIDGVIAIQDVYRPLLTAMLKLKEPELLAQCSRYGVRWAITGGETRGVELERAIAVDGMDNVIQVLEQVEDGLINDVDFIEALACMGGCVGGPLTVINGYVAKSQLRRAEYGITAMPEDKKRALPIDEAALNFFFTREIQSVTGMRLDSDMSEAIRKMEVMRGLLERLPKIDCGSCGSPTCRALAEDVAQDDAGEEDCVFMLRQRVKELAEMMANLSSKLPQTINRDGQS